MPGPYAFKDGYFLALNYLASAAPSEVICNARVRYDNGKKDDITIRITSFTTDRTVSTNYPGTNITNTTVSRPFQDDGEIIALTVQQRGNTLIKRGQFYVVLVIGDAGGMDGNRIAADYLTPSQIGLGQFAHSGPGGGEGFRREITTADPAANAEVAVQVVPTNAMWKIHSYTVVMAQGITDTPHPALVIADTSGAGNIQFLIPIGADIAVSTTVRCSWVLGAGDTKNNVTGGSMVTGIPEMFLNEADGIATSTQGLGANSDYGVAVLEVEEWLVI